MTTKPGEVKWAISLFWGSLAAAPFKAALDWGHLITIAPILTIVRNMTITMAVASLLFWKTAQGKNWARITLLAFGVLGLPFYWHFTRGEFHRNPISGFLSALQLVMQWTGFWLIFTAPGSDWFKAQPIESSFQK